MKISPYAPSPTNTPIIAAAPTAASNGGPDRTQYAARPSGGPTSSAASPQKTISPVDEVSPRMTAPTT